MEHDEDTLLHFAVLALGLRAVLDVGRFGAGNGLPGMRLASSLLVACTEFHLDSDPVRNVVLIWSLRRVCFPYFFENLS